MKNVEKKGEKNPEKNYEKSPKSKAEKMSKKIREIESQIKSRKVIFRFHVFFRD